MVVSYLCSKDKEVQAHEQPYWPMIAELDGYIFCDVDVRHFTTVDVYRDDWMGPMGPKCVGVKGDKGQVASLLRKPTILFDDKEDNVQRSATSEPIDYGLHFGRLHRAPRAQGHRPRGERLLEVEQLQRLGHGRRGVRCPTRAS